jgi:hypothetical protein
LQENVKENEVNELNRIRRETGEKEILRNDESTTEDNKEAAVASTDKEEADNNKPQEANSNLWNTFMNFLSSFQNMFGGSNPAPPAPTQEEPKQN